ncbi:transmembrane protein 183B isoform X2 [Odontomachus brunneus]|uniref:transmembrane protein 183B isoform X2 n=1 Tax=Odontomachus brunneus TaxID=486640 RepID=UPI0013F21B4C|nr:transmembrane protein 183B isoform X2 [Odontomachus brunneus]
MSSLRKKANRKATEAKRTDNLVGDVTIDDFANTLQIHRRLKKAATNVSNKVKERVTKEEKLWDETNESLLQDNMKEDIDKVPRVNTKKGKRKFKSLKEDTKEDEGIDYPLDIWFIISEYIPPETVGKFARICRSSYYVTTTAKFWFHLYKTYHEYVPDLPERLQPECMMRQHGLRACVIRALHYNYFTSLLQREIDNVPYLRQEEPHSLVRRKCTHMWHKEGKIRCYFFFKLKETSKYRNSSLKENNKCNSEKTEFIEMLEDVSVNSEDGCKVLRVTCVKYCMLPPVIGLILQTVSMGLMPGYRKHRLRLGFGTSIVSGTLTTEVILSDVTGYRILDWWDPYYPHHDATFMIDFRQSDSD